VNCLRGGTGGAAVQIVNGAGSVAGVVSGGTGGAPFMTVNGAGRGGGAIAGVANINCLRCDTGGAAVQIVNGAGSVAGVVSSGTIGGAVTIVNGGGTSAGVVVTSPAQCQSGSTVGGAVTIAVVAVSVMVAAAAVCVNVLFLLSMHSRCVGLWSELLPHLQHFLGSVLTGSALNSSTFRIFTIPALRPTPGP